MNNFISMISNTSTGLESHSKGIIPDNVGEKRASVSAGGQSENQNGNTQSLDLRPLKNGPISIEKSNGETTFEDVFSKNLPQKFNDSGLEILVHPGKDDLATTAEPSIAPSDTPISSTENRELQVNLNPAILQSHPSTSHSAVLDTDVQVPIEMTENSSGFRSEAALEIKPSNAHQGLVSPHIALEFAVGTRPPENTIPQRPVASEKPFSIGEVEIAIKQLTPSLKPVESTSLPMPPPVSLSFRSEIESTWENPVDAYQTLNSTPNTNLIEPKEHNSVRTPETPLVQSQRTALTSASQIMTPTVSDAKPAMPYDTARNVEVLKEAASLSNNSTSLAVQNRPSTQLISTQHPLTLDRDPISPQSGIGMSFGAIPSEKTVPQSVNTLEDDHQSTRQTPNKPPDGQPILSAFQPTLVQKEDVVKVAPFRADARVSNEPVGGAASLVTYSKTTEVYSAAPPSKIGSSLVDTSFNMAPPLVDSFANELSFTPETMNLDPNRGPVAQTQNPTVAPPLHSDLARSVAQQLVAASISEPNKPMELALSPEELGRVKLTFSSGDGGMVVSILAERPETLDLMRRNITSLAQEFLGMGYDQISFNFNQSGSEQQQNGQPTPNHSQKSPSVFPPNRTQDSTPIAIDLTQTDRVDIRI